MVAFIYEQMKARGHSLTFLLMVTVWLVELEFISQDEFLMKVHVCGKEGNII